MTAVEAAPAAFSATGVRVRLVGATPRPFDAAAAAALSSARARLVLPEEAAVDPALRDRVAARTRRAGHTTTLEHAHLHFALEGVSRLAVWAFLHDHPFHASTQVSQRYVRVDPRCVHVPRLSDGGREVFLAAAEEAGSAYERLAALLEPAARRKVAETFPARPSDGPLTRRAAARRSIEAARYVLPVAALAHLHHTVSALTLLRYRRAAALEASDEIRTIVEAMCAEAARHDVDLLRDADDAIPVEETAEVRLLAALESSGPAPDAWFDDFDASLGGRASALVETPSDVEGSIARAVRTALAATPAALSDDAAVAAAIDPAANPLLADPLGAGAHSRAARALAHVRLTFARRLSLAADAQDQRHRLVPSTRPALARHLRPDRPDVVVPSLIREVPEAEAVFHEAMERRWEAVRRLLDAGEPIASVVYLLPNAFAVRSIASGDLWALRHKWALRLCRNAQEEIRRAAEEEVAQVRSLAPRLGARIGPPCALRDRAGAAPPCPEGPAYCGVPVWRAGA